MTYFDTADNIHIGGTEIEKVTNYEYRRQPIAVENRTRQEVLVRIKQDGAGKVQKNLTG